MSQPSNPDVIGYSTSPRTRMPSPWLFVPVLYFMQSVPNILATDTYTSVFKNLGMKNLEVAFWTSIVALPWTFKLFWAPLVDLTFTKRSWTLAMQFAITISLIIAAYAVQTEYYFQATIATLFLVATFSATHDIACDGLYLMSLDRDRQARFSGVMGTFSRFGRMFATFLLPFVAGKLQNHGMDRATSWSVTFYGASMVYAAGAVWNFFILPRPEADRPVGSDGETGLTILRTLLVILTGIAAYFAIDSIVQLTGYSIYQASAPGTLPANWGMTDHDRNVALYLLIGCVCAVVPLIIACGYVLRGTLIGTALATYVTQRGFAGILGFLVFYRFGEAMVLKMLSPFLLDDRDKGGMGLKVDVASQIQGLAAPIGLILGGLLGGAFIGKVGLRKAFWPIVFCMHTPNLLYVAVAYFQPDHKWLYPVAFIEAFGYGFGFSAYFVYLMDVAQRGRFTTSHYAIGTGLGALFITFAGITAGVVQQAMGWVGFFTVACLMTIPGTLTLLFIPMDNNEGRGVKAEAGGH